MKKILLFTAALLTGFMLHAQQIDTLAAWTFPSGVDTLDIYPDVAIPNNSNYYLSAEDTISWPNTTLRDVTSSEGATTFAGTATGWENGNNNKLWSIKFKAPGYINLKVSSKQFSDPEFPGPKDWKIQARLSDEDWIDLDGSTIECASDWTTGVANEIELPEIFNDPGSTSIYIRWIMTSNMSTAGTDVEATGISKIDDVIVTGEVISGVDKNIAVHQFIFYPNPVQSGKIYFKSEANISSLRIFDTNGKLMNELSVEGINTISLMDMDRGIYFIEPVYSNGQAGLTRKLVIL